MRIPLLTVTTFLIVQNFQNRKRIMWNMEM